MFVFFSGSGIGKNKSSGRPIDIMSESIRDTGREYDFIIYGASGYAAGYIIDAFKGENVKLALAARDASKIKNRDFPLYECTIDEIDKVTSITRVLINCVGPYYRHGEAIVRSCIRNNTHYMDINGEVYFFELLISKYHDEATRKKIYIISCCGFDSVPADIGVMYLNNMFDTVEIEGVLRFKDLLVNTTTWESLLGSVSNFRETVALREKRYGVSKRRRPQRLIRETNSYQVIFRGSDYSVTKRSQILMKSVGLKGAKYSTYLDVGGRMNMIRYRMLLILIWVLSSFAIGKWLIRNAYTFFAFGFVKKNPCPDRVRKASFSIEMLAMGEKDGRMLNKTLTISGSDPAYIVTSICMTQTAITFLECLEKRPEGTGVTLFEGGVITPACILYNTDIVRRLLAKGLRFDITA